jgi:hypothetical protein
MIVMMQAIYKGFAQKNFFELPHIKQNFCFALFFIKSGLYLNLSNRGYGMCILMFFSDDKNLAKAFKPCKIPSKK